MLAQRNRAAVVFLFTAVFALAGLGVWSQSKNSSPPPGPIPKLPPSDCSTGGICIKGELLPSSTLPEWDTLAAHVRPGAPYTVTVLRGPNVAVQGRGPANATKMVTVAIYELNVGAAAKAAMRRLPRTGTAQAMFLSSPQSESKDRAQPIKFQRDDKLQQMPPTLEAANTARLSARQLGMSDHRQQIAFELGDRPQEVTLTFAPATVGAHFYVAVVSGKNNIGRNVQTTGMFIVEK